MAVEEEEVEVEVEEEVADEEYDHMDIFFCDMD